MHIKCGETDMGFCHYLLPVRSCPFHVRPDYPRKVYIFFCPCSKRCFPQFLLPPCKINNHVASKCGLLVALPRLMLPRLRGVLFLFLLPAVINYISNQQCYFYKNCGSDSTYKLWYIHKFLLVRRTRANTPQNSLHRRFS